jgi:hypothetical protein
MMMIASLSSLLFAVRSSQFSLRTGEKKQKQRKGTKGNKHINPSVPALPCLALPCLLCLPVHNSSDNDKDKETKWNEMQKQKQNADGMIRVNRTIDDRTLIHRGTSTRARPPARQKGEKRLDDETHTLDRKHRCARASHLYIQPDGSESYLISRCSVAV